MNFLIAVQTHLSHHYFGNGDAAIARWYPLVNKAHN